MNPDHINGTFEFGGALVTWVNIRAIWRAKRYVGVSLLPWAFFTMWGWWNLYYYPHLEQFWSFVGGAALVASNTIFSALMFKYKNR